LIPSTSPSANTGSPDEPVKFVPEQAPAGLAGQVTATDQAGAGRKQVEVKHAAEACPTARSWDLRFERASSSSLRSTNNPPRAPITA
jgi:hypothetical protein